MPELQTLLQVVGAIVLGGGTLAGIAFGLFKKFGENWLDAKFQERLAAYKHEQQKELEELRLKISTLLDRSIKFHQREFDVLPEAWSRINDAFGATVSIVSALQSYPDLDRTTPEQLDEFLSKSPLQKWEIAELERATKKTDYYIRRIAWHRIAKARDAYHSHHDYIRKNGIFITPDIRIKFDELDDLIWSALVEHEVNEQFRDQQMAGTRDKIQALTKNGEGRRKALEAEVQRRLWN